MDDVIKEFNPSIVVNAAAHKHVPLMEASPLEAIKNNVFGTYNVANCADKYNCKKMILISTDKAVNPTNIMGATKRLCEMIIQAKDKESETEFVAVRFGNVLGSNIANLGFIAGLTALLLPFFVTKKIITLDIKVMILLALFFAFFAMDGEFSRLEGCIVFLILVTYTIVLLRMSKGESEENEIEKPERSLWLNIPLLIASLADFFGI